MAETHLTRRELIQKSGMILLGSAALRGGAATTAAPQRPAAATSEADGADELPAADTGPLKPLNRSPRSVQEYYVRRTREVDAEGNARRAALKTREDAERYVADVRARLQQCCGSFPEKTPLNPRVTAVHEREGFKIENVIFESLPGVFVTANLYVPTGRSSPMPAVLEPCGHSDSGKALGTYQSAAHGLVRLGYVVLVFDPIGQGERVQHLDENLKPLFGLGTSEHTYVGVRRALLGESLARWFTWDSIRALDYLLSRPEVDPAHVGVTGNSGGGGQTSRLCGLEPRITMAAPSCYITTLRRHFENENSQDPENYLWSFLARGLDHSDLIAAMAPKPVILLGQELDQVDARGFEETAARLSHLYRLLGAERNFSSYLGSGYHGYSRENREAMYRWFNQHTGQAPVAREPALKLEKESDLRCTSRGQVAELNSRTVFTVDREKSQKLRSSRPKLDEAGLIRAVNATLLLPAREGIPDYRILREGRSRRYPQKNSAAYILETEANVHVFLYRLSNTPLPSRIPRGPDRALLYVSHESADEELRSDPWLKEMIEAESKSAIFACDVRGVGESKPVLSTPGNPAKGGADYFHAALGLLFNYSTPAQRTHDLLRVVDLLRECGHLEIHLVARGWGTIPGLFTALLHDGVTQVTLKHAPTSYGEIAESERYGWPLSALVPGVLQSFDLPDCYRILARKKLQQVEPASAMGVPA